MEMSISSEVVRVAAVSVPGGIVLGVVEIRQEGLDCGGMLVDLPVPLFILVASADFQRVAVVVNQFFERSGDRPFSVLSTEQGAVGLPDRVHLLFLRCHLSFLRFVVPLFSGCYLV